MKNTAHTKKTTISWLQRKGIKKASEEFIESLATLLSSGITISQALRVASKETRSQAMKLIVQRIGEEIEEGRSLWEALSAVHLFSKEYIELIRVGEESGTLHTNLHFVVEQQKRNRSFRSKIYSGMIYPVLVLIVTGLVGSGVVIFVLPKLARVFEELNITLPFITRMVLGLGELIQRYGVWAVPAFLILLVVVFLTLFVFKKTKHSGEYLLLHIPGIGRLLKEIEIARFGYTLGSLLEGGVLVLDALESLKETTTLRSYHRFFEHLYVNIQEGRTFQEAFATYYNISALIPPSVEQLIISGEESGKLSQMLLKSGNTYEERIDQTAKNITVMLEPMLLVIVWLGVLLVALSVISPIYSLVGGIS